MIFISISSVQHQTGPTCYEVPELNIVAGKLAKRFVTKTGKTSSLSQRIKSGYKHEMIVNKETSGKVLLFARVDISAEQTQYVLSDCYCYETEADDCRWLIFEPGKIQETKQSTKQSKKSGK